MGMRILRRCNMEFNEAKEMSLAKWKRHLEEYPDIKVRWEGSGHPAGECGFCLLYQTDCERCPLYPETCCNSGYDSDALYWRIVARIEAGHGRGFKTLIRRMIREIEKAEEVTNG